MINFLSPTGAKAIMYGNYIVKLNSEIFVVLDETDFHSLFNIKSVFIN